MEVATQLLTKWANRVDTVAGTYTVIGSIAEFWDSVVVIPDLRDQKLWRVNVRAGSPTELGTTGSGPGEYRRMMPAIKMGADSVALAPGFLGMSFPLISVATGRGHTISTAARTNTRPVQFTLALSEGPLMSYGDASGNIYGTPIPPIREGARRDSFPIVRWHRENGKVDTLFHFRPEGSFIRPTRAADGTQEVELELGPYGASNSWLPTGDGRVIVADAAQYLIQLRDSIGQILTGLRVRRAAVPVSVSRWNQYMGDLTKTWENFQKQNKQKITAQMGVAPPTGPERRYVIPPMPIEMPLLNFSQGRRMHFADGVVWVPVHAAEPPTVEVWDLIDMSLRKRIASVALAPHQRLSHVTTLGAYVVATDEDDLQRLLLYRHAR